MKLVNCVCSERRGSFSLQFDLNSLSFKQTHRAKETFKGGFIHWRFVVVIMKLVNCVCSKGRGRFSLQFDNLIFLVSSSPSKSWLMAHNSSSWWWPTTSQPTKKPMFLLEGYCMFACLFVYLFMVAWRIEPVFAVFPKATHPIPHPRGWIIRRRHESSDGLWTVLIYLVALNPRAAINLKHTQFHEINSGFLDSRLDRLNWYVSSS